MRTTRLLHIPALLIALAGTTLAQRVQSPQRGRQPQRFNQPNRPPRGGNYTFTSKSLPAEYSVLLTRTIFAREHVIPPIADSRDRNPGPRRTEYIFRGTMVENGTRFLAGIENRSSNRTIFYAEGGSVPALNVRVTQISLDHIIVTDRTGRRLIHIGEAIDAGTQIANPATLPAVANGPRPSEDPQ
jgi:hypothetical protein